MKIPVESKREQASKHNSKHERTAIRLWSVRIIFCAKTDHREYQI